MGKITQPDIERYFNTGYETCKSRVLPSFMEQANYAARNTYIPSVIEPSILSIPDKSSEYIPVLVICERYCITIDEVRTGAKDIGLKFTNERIGFLKKRLLMSPSDTLPLIRRVVFNRSSKNGYVNTKPIREFFRISFEQFKELYEIGHQVINERSDFDFEASSYRDVFNMLYAALNQTLMDANTVVKTVSKSEAKKKLKRKFHVGDLISLKTKSVCGSREIIKGYEVKKCVYTINNNEVNILILKQIYGPEDKIFTLNRNDCEKLHVKFEPGLQVFSMLLNWGTYKKQK